MIIFWLVSLILLRLIVVCLVLFLVFLMVCISVFGLLVIIFLICYGLDWKVGGYLDVFRMFNCLEVLVFMYSNLLLVFNWFVIFLIVVVIDDLIVWIVFGICWFFWFIRWIILIVDIWLRVVFVVKIFFVVNLFLGIDILFWWI